jgi:hypothetical protein
MVGMAWWHPVMGCDSLQIVADNARDILRSRWACPTTPPAPEVGELAELVEWLQSMRELAGDHNPEEQRRYDRAAVLIQQPSAPAPAVVVVAARRGWDDGLMAGVCVALATVTLHYDSVIWKEIVQSVGIDSLLNYAANVNPEDWDLAGFGKYAQAELGKDRPDSLPQAGEVES